MMLALLAVAALSLAQPPDNSCAPEGVAVQPRLSVTLVERDAVVEFPLGVYNNGPTDVPTSLLSLRIDSTARVARLDAMTVEVAEEGGPWRRLDRSAGPDWSFTAPVAEFPLPPGTSRTFMVRIRLDPGQTGSLKPGAELTLAGGTCTVRGGFDLRVRGEDPVTARGSNGWPPLLLGVGLGAAGVLVLYWVRPRRQPARLARRARS